MIRPNDFAFPQKNAVGADGVFIENSKGGLTKREYFAAKALPVLMKLHVVKTRSIGFRIRLGLRRMLPSVFPPVKQINEHFYDISAEQAVKYADALIEALNK